MDDLEDDDIEMLKEPPTGLYYWHGRIGRLLKAGLVTYKTHRRHVPARDVVTVDFVRTAAGAEAIKNR